MDGTGIEAIKIIRAQTPADFTWAGVLAAALWPHHTAQEMKEDLESRDRAQNVVLVAYAGERAIGFAHVGLRHDYVQGADSSPVGYLEGIYVDVAYRMHGVARRLVDAGCVWAKECGCTQFASDCELENVDSERMHKALGFEEAGRIVCFVKEIE